jgi:hypothetical protein
VSAIEELLGRKSSGFGLENREYGRRDPPRDTLYPQKLAQTWPRSFGRSAELIFLCNMMGFAMQEHAHLSGTRQHMLWTPLLLEFTWKLG